MKLLSVLLIVCCFGLAACDSQSRGEPLTEETDGSVTDASDLSADTEVEPTDTEIDLTDTSVDGEADLVVVPTKACLVEVGDPASDAVFECSLDARTMLGCEELARCVCGAWSSFSSPEPVDVEACVFSLAVPRGAITLADFCTLSGNSGATSLLEIGEQAWSTAPVEDLTLSPECGSVAAFTLWGEAPALQWQVSLVGEAIPSLGTALVDYPLENTVFTELSEVESFDLASRTLTLAADAAPLLKSRIEALTDGLLGRFFVFHDTRRPLLQGVFVTNLMSSTRDGLVVLVEDLSDSSYDKVPIRNGYPQLELPPDSYELSMFAAVLAAQGKLTDAACISSCGCGPGRACANGLCVARTSCTSDSDCCLGTCQAGACQ